MALAVSSLDYSRSLNLPPGFVSLLSLSSRAASLCSVAVAWSAAVLIFASFGSSFLLNGAMRYVIMTGLPFWNDLIYMTFSGKQSATERPVLPMGTLPISIGLFIE